MSRIDGVLPGGVHASPAITTATPLGPLPTYPTIRASELRIGDVCSGSGCVVESVPWISDGHVTFTGRYPRGGSKTVRWNARTTLTVRRLPTAFDEQVSADRARTDADPFARIRR